MVKSKILIFLVIFVFAGCGYTTRGFLNPEYKRIYVEPVKNKIDITNETAEYNSYRSYPPLIENDFTRNLISRFNLDGNLKTTNDKDKSQLDISCEITDFLREVVRSDDNDNVEAYRLKIFYRFYLYDSQGKLLKEVNLSTDKDYSLVGIYAKSEAKAISELLDDAARRVVESIVEEW